MLFFMRVLRSYVEYMHKNSKNNYYCLQNGSIYFSKTFIYFEMCTSPNMENNSWKEYVLDMIRDKIKLLNTVLERKKRRFRHILSWTLKRRESCEKSD